jgi:hypothetical protein
MFRRTVTTSLVLAMTAVAIGSGFRIAQAAPAVELSTGTRTAPAAPLALGRQAAPAATALTAAQMSADRGGWPGILRKLLSKWVKKIIRIIWEIITTTVYKVGDTETTEYVDGISGTVTETYEGTDVDETVYASQADYDANVVQSTEFTDNGYSYVSTDYSAGCYCSDGPLDREAQTY